MDSDSDESFAWTGTSSDNSSSGCETMAKKNKKNLPEEDENNKDENISTVETKKKKNKKSKGLSDVEVYIKKEPESDIDTITKKKKKSKHSDISENDLHESMLLDESYLNLRVKQEKSTFLEPSPVKAATNATKRKRSFSNSSTSSQNSETNHIKLNENKKSRKKEKHSDAFNNSTNNDSAIASDECNNAVSKKKRKDSAVHSENSLTDEKSFIKKIKGQGNSNQTYSSKEFVDDDSSSDESVNFQHPVTDNKKIASSTLIKDVQQNGILHTKILPTERLISGSSNMPPNSKKPTKMSERIEFEDEDEVETPQGHSNAHTIQSALMRRFLKTHNKNFQTINHEPGKENNVCLTDNDEIWVLKFPHDVNIKLLTGTNITIDSKSKLKINSQTYEGILDRTQSKIALLTADGNKCTLNNIDFNGTVNFRKRIPKAHFVKDNIIENLQTNFIPLPDTKCRHPLFGANYKKAIKISSTIKERLNSKPKKKKKHKKEKKLEVPEEEEETQMTQEEEEVPLKKKKRKRKLSADEVDFPKKAKRLKRDPDTTEAWESAQDIEQKLFNF